MYENCADVTEKVARTTERTENIVFRESDETGEIYRNTDMKENRGLEIEINEV